MILCAATVPAGTLLISYYTFKRWISFSSLRKSGNYIYFFHAIKKEKKKDEKERKQQEF